MILIVFRQRAYISSLIGSLDSLRLDFFSLRWEAWVSILRLSSNAGSTLSVRVNPCTIATRSFIALSKVEALQQVPLRLSAPSRFLLR